MKSKKLMTAALAVAALATASIAAAGDAQARGGHGGGHGGGFRGGFHGGAKFFHGGGRHFGHRWYGHRRFFGYGYAYNTCWKYTPYGLVNVCKVPY